MTDKVNITVKKANLIRILRDERIIIEIDCRSNLEVEFFVSGIGSEVVHKNEYVSMKTLIDHTLEGPYIDGLIKQEYTIENQDEGAAPWKISTNDTGLCVTAPCGSAFSFSFEMWEIIRAEMDKIFKIRKKK